MLISKYFSPESSGLFLYLIKKVSQHIAHKVIFSAASDIAVWQTDLKKKNRNTVVK